MTNEDKKLIADYMGWEKGCDYHEPCNPLYSDSCEGCRYVTGVVNYDLNDASFCVQEMQKRGEYADFIRVAYGWYNPIYKILGEDINFTAWLMSMEEGQAKNFFKSMVEWRKGK